MVTSLTLHVVIFAWHPLQKYTGNRWCRTTQKLCSEQTTDNIDRQKVSSARVPFNPLAEPLHYKDHINRQYRVLGLVTPTTTGSRC